LRLKNKENYTIFGQLAHNKNLNGCLGEAGLDFATNIDSVEKNVIIPAHGLDRQKKEKLANYTDLTCPFVQRLHDKAKLAEKKNFQIIIIGDKNHIEIKNTISYLKNPIVVDSIEEAKALNNFSQIAVLSQTTATEEKIKKILPVLKTKTKKLTYIPTRCGSTEDRQKEAKWLAKKADLLIVVGDHNSANANNLVSIGRAITKSVLVESEKEINSKLFSDIENVAIIASASTPYFVVEKIIQSIKNIE
jgi:4-hydroxy-3-methylbut-2-enyl diphosphate reductase